MTFQPFREKIFRVAYKIRGEDVFGNRNEIELAERLTHDDFRRYQSDKFLELLEYVKKRIVFYENLNLFPVPVSQMDSIFFSRIPIVDRHVIIPKLKDFTDKKLRASWRSTSGTSGTPFIFPKDRIASGYMDAVMHNVYGWHGISVGDNQARLWGGALSAKSRVAQELKDFLLGRKRLSVFHCNDKVYSAYFESLQQFKPKFFYAYANALYRFALYVEETGRKGRELGLSVAICTGEMLFLHQREKIHEVFGCRVVNEYGSTENGIIGFECEAGSMHIMPTIALEIENPDHEGFGQMLVTELNSRSVPFLRYRIGDIARCIDDDCACGRTLPRMELGSGRVNDQIVCPDGAIVYATVIAYALKGSVLEFRAIQETISKLEIQIVPSEKWNLSTQKKIEVSLRKHLGHEINIEFTLLTEIQPEKTGKLRYFISNLPKETIR